MIKMSLKPEYARQFLQVLGAVVDEFRLTVTPDGWLVKTVDPGNVAMVALELPKNNFETWEFTPPVFPGTQIREDDSIKVGIDVDNIKSFFGGMSESEFVLQEEIDAPVEFVFSKAPDKYQRDSVRNRYQLDIRQGMFSRRYLLFPEGELRKAPKIFTLDLPYKLEMNALEFRRICLKAEKINDYITLQVQQDDGGEPVFSAITVDDNEQPWEARPHVRFAESSQNAQKVVKSLYSLDYLSDITRVIPAGQITMQLGNDYPLILSFEIGGKGTVQFMMAPRIESE